MNKRIFAISKSLYYVDTSEDIAALFFIKLLKFSSKHKLFFAKHFSFIFFASFNMFDLQKSLDLFSKSFGSMNFTHFSH